MALKEIRLQEEEGAPFTAIREGTELLGVVLALGIILVRTYEVFSPLGQLIS